MMNWGKLCIFSIMCFFTWAVHRLYQLKRSLYQSGCRPPVNLPSKDPVFGIDRYLETFRLMLNNQLLSTLFARFEHIGHTYSLGSLGAPIIFTRNMENLRSVYWTNHDTWGVAPLRIPVRKFFGHGVITSDGNYWKKSRDFLRPSFAKSQVNNLEPLGQHFQNFLERLPKDGTTIDLQPLLFGLYLDAACTFLFGESIARSSKHEILSSGIEFRTAFDQGLKEVGLRISLGPFAFLLPKLGWIRARTTVHDYIGQHVDKALKISTDDGGSHLTSPKRSHVLLHRLAKATSSREELYGQVLNAMMASLETTAVLISNCVFELARAPLLWKRVQQECAMIENSEMNFDTMRNLPTLRNVLMESLRLYPILPRNSRVALRDTTLPKGGGEDGEHPIYVKKGSRLDPGFFAIHRDSHIWGPDAETFNPDRWDTASPEAWEFVPFGAGPRACLGKTKSLTEASYIIARISKEFDRIESRDCTPWVGKMRITTRSANGCKVGFFGVCRVRICHGPSHLWRYGSQVFANKVKHILEALTLCEGPEYWTVSDKIICWLKKDFFGHGVTDDPDQDQLVQRG